VTASNCFTADVTGVVGPANITICNSGTAPGNIAINQVLTSTGNLTIRLQADGQVTQAAAGVITTTGSLGVRAGTGILLGTATNAVGNFSAADTTSGNIVLKDSTPTLTLGDLVSASTCFANPVTGVTGP